MTKDLRRDQKTQDLTLALTSPDVTKQDKRFHVETDATIKAMERNSQKQQRTQG